MLHNTMQDIATQTLLRFLHLCHQSALEACNEAFLHSLKRYRWAVACHDNLLTILAQMVENVEEGILRTFQSHQFLNIINNKHVDALIEVNEVVKYIAVACIGELHHEEVGTQVKDTLLGM